MKIPFNKPYITGKEVHYIYDAVATGKISGNGKYTKMCQQYFEDRWGFKKTLLTTSCTDALEMCALLLDIRPGDEVIVPSYTFVSTALAFVRQGAKIVFADSRSDHPGIDEDKIEELITSKTKAIVPVHYSGVACDMIKIMDIANRHNIFVVEDAAQAIDSYFIPASASHSPTQIMETGTRNKEHGTQNNKQPLGTIGHLSTFSFHETKNIQCGEGGLLGINDERFIKRAEIIWEKGTNRAAFFRGEIDKYGWVDIGSSFLPSEVTAAFLWAQIEHVNMIQKKRCTLWQSYLNNLESWAAENDVKLPYLPEYATNNAHIFYMVCPDINFRTKLISHLKSHNIGAVFHYQSLHNSSFYSKKHDCRELFEANRYSSCLLRLPMYFDLLDSSIKQVCNEIKYNYTPE
jgi:dTDP-4-amino-4,6-dideoxygalactose transaminase